MKSVIVSPSICQEVTGLNAMILILFYFLMLSFKPIFHSPLSLVFAIGVVSSAYLRLLMFLPTILIPAFASSSPAFCMMYSACKQISRLTIHSLDVLLSQFWTSPFFHVQFQLLLLDLHTGFSGGRLSGLVVPSLSEFSTVYCDLHKGFHVINKAEIDPLLEFSCFFYDSTDVENLMSCSSAFLKSSLNICI